MYFPLEKLSAAVPDAAAFVTPSAHKYIFLILLADKINIDNYGAKVPRRDPN